MEYFIRIIQKIYRGKRNLIPLLLLLLSIYNQMQKCTEQEQSIELKQQQHRIKINCKLRQKRATKNQSSMKTI